MKVLLISNMFPPYIMGGAEMAAHSLAVWLSGQGVNVHVLTSAHERHLEGIESVEENFTVERRFFPNLYQIYQAKPRHAVAKVAWHAQDHFHLKSESIVSEVLERFQPDLVNTHSLQGIGYNLLRAIGRSGIPCVQTMHDFGFICVNVNRFKNGAECNRHHFPCQMSTQIKRSYLEGIARLTVLFPSQALLNSFRPHLPSRAQAAAIPLTLIFQNPPMQPRNADGKIRLLYVGQVTPWKGVAFITEIVSSLPSDAPIQFDVIGGGSDLESLREKFASDRRITFHGKQAPENVGHYMAAADLLLTPSLWFENAPLVVSQALQMGLPVFASRIGGLPELVIDRVTGRLLVSGDAADWRAAMMEVLRHPEQLASWRKGAEELSVRFSADHLGQRVLELFREMTESPSPLPC